MNPDDILIEIDDPGDAEIILAALNEAAAREYRTSSEAVKQANPVLADYHFSHGRRIDAIAFRFQVALDPEPEPPDEYEPPLPKDDFTGAELVQIRRQGADAVTFATPIRFGTSDVSA